MPNSQEQLKNASVKVQSAWNQKGSWILLVAFGIAMFLAGAGFQAWTLQDVFRTQQTSFDEKEKHYLGRIRELHERNYSPDGKALLPKIEEVSKQVEKAAQTAEQASQKVEATTSKVQEVIDNGKDFSKTGGQ